VADWLAQQLDATRLLRCCKPRCRGHGIDRHDQPVHVHGSVEILRSLVMRSVLAPRTQLAVVLACIGLLAAACGGPTTVTAQGETQATPVGDQRAGDVVTEAADDTLEPTAAPETPEPEPTTAAAQPTVVATTEPAAPTEERPAAPNGRVAPLVSSTATELAAQIAEAETGLLAEDATERELGDWGHLHQVAIRKLGYQPDWDIQFFEALPSEFHARTLLHISARRALIDLKSGYDAADFIPAWEIVEPESADALLSYYQEAESATGIDWEYLAGINLVETGMGRIRGLSSAGAQGPMQFLPTTWAEAGIGEGDIESPRDAINAAARYLVRRGGPADMPGAIWGYNNSDDYVTAVMAYAELLRQDPDAYQAIYNWEIYFFTEEGDVWLPSGFRTDETLDLADYLRDNPWSIPDPGLR